MRAPVSGMWDRPHSMRSTSIASRAGSRRGKCARWTTANGSSKSACALGGRGAETSCGGWAPTLTSCLKGRCAGLAHAQVRSLRSLATTARPAARRRSAPTGACRPPIVENTAPPPACVRWNARVRAVRSLACAYWPAAGAPQSVSFLPAAVGRRPDLPGPLLSTARPRAAREPAPCPGPGGGSMSQRDQARRAGGARAGPIPTPVGPRPSLDRRRCAVAESDVRSDAETMWRGPCAFRGAIPFLNRNPTVVRLDGHETHRERGRGREREDAAHGGASRAHHTPHHRQGARARAPRRRWTR